MIGLHLGPQGAAPGAHRGKHHVAVVLELSEELQGVAIGGDGVERRGPGGLQAQQRDLIGQRRQRLPLKRLAVQEIALLPLLTLQRDKLRSYNKILVYISIYYIDIEIRLE